MSKIYHLDDLEEFIGADDWRLQINIVDLWNQFEKKEISFDDFNKQYYNRLVEYKQQISNLGNDVWTNLEKLLVDLNEKKGEELTNVYENIYDWADNNEVLIKTK